MNPKALIALAASAGIIAVAAGCGSDEEGLSRTEVEERVAEEVGDNEAKRATARCVEGSAERTFRCEVTIENTTGTYDARVSKDGKRVLIDQR